MRGRWRRIEAIGDLAGQHERPASGPGLLEIPCRHGIMRLGRHAFDVKPADERVIVTVDETPRVAEYSARAMS
jgi:hypothetical protein